jgi:hypothetical protein
MTATMLSHHHHHHHHFTSLPNASVVSPPPPNSRLFAMGWGWMDERIEITDAKKTRSWRETMLNHTTKCRLLCCGHVQSFYQKWYHSSWYRTNRLTDGENKQLQQLSQIILFCTTIPDDDDDELLLLLLLLQWMVEWSLCVEASEVNGLIRCRNNNAHFEEKIISCGGQSDDMNILNE